MIGGSVIDIRIVDAALSHAQGIAELEEKYIDCAWTAEQVKAELQKDNVIFLAAEHDGKLVGYVSGEIAADEIELGNVAVDENYRRQGVGTALLRAFIMRAKQRAVKRIFLLVSAENSAAISLYGAVGFSQTGRRRGYYGNSDAIIMEIDI